MVIEPGFCFGIKHTSSLEETVASALVGRASIRYTKVVEKTAELLALSERSRLIDKVADEAESISTNAGVGQCADAQNTGKIALSHHQHKGIGEWCYENVLKIFDGIITNETVENGRDNAAKQVGKRKESSQGRGGWRRANRVNDRVGGPVDRSNLTLLNAGWGGHDSSSKGRDSSERGLHVCEFEA